MPDIERTLMIVLVAAFGAAIGSWLNVVILRLQSDHSTRLMASQRWWQGRSACPHCGTALHWYELVPVISFVILGGRCRSCRRALTRQYIIVEVLTAAGFAVVWTHVGLSWLLLSGWALVAAMLLIAVYDARWALIPDSFSAALIVAAGATAALSGLTLTDMLAGSLLGGAVFALQHVLSRRRWVGSGDIFLGLGLGLLLGWRHVALALFLAYMSGALVASMLIVARKLRTSSTMPFGPYLMAAGFVTWLWGERMIDWYFAHALFL